jgi:hypothetical protein
LQKHLSALVFAIEMSNDVYAQTKEQNEKFKKCHEIREKSIPNNSNGLACTLY